MIGAAVAASAQQHSKPTAAKKNPKNPKKPQDTSNKQDQKTSVPAGGSAHQGDGKKDNKKKKGSGEKRPAPPTTALKKEWLKFAKDYIAKHKVSSGKPVTELMKEAGEEWCPHLLASS